MTSAAATPGPLDGITVISVEQAVAAPYATRQLADLGARVIKVERPGDGDFARGYDTSVNGLSSYFVWLNRSKESVTLDLKMPDGRTILEALLARADVFVHNLAPGAIERLGFGPAALADRLPRLISCTISGYGSSGPWADRKAYDLLVQAETGLLSITGSAEGAARVGISVADIAAGMYAYSGVLTALLQRAMSGRVSAVEVSLFEALAEWMGAPANFTRYGGTTPERVGSAHATIAPYGTYATADGVILLAVQNEREWERLCTDVLLRPALASDARFATNPSRVAERPALDAVILERFATMPTVEVEDVLTRAGIANGRMNTMAEFLDHPVLRARDRWSSIGTPNGPVDALIPPAVLGGVEPRMGAVPAIGEHTQRILRELGFDQARIRSLRSAGVIDLERS